MAEVGRNINNAWDTGYAASFHFGMDITHNPYTRKYMRNAWMNGWVKGKEDKLASKRTIKAYEEA